MKIPSLKIKRSSSGKIPKRRSKNQEATSLEKKVVTSEMIVETETVVETETTTNKGAGIITNTLKEIHKTIRNIRWFDWG